MIDRLILGLVALSCVGIAGCGRKAESQQVTADAAPGAAMATEVGDAPVLSGAGAALDELPLKRGYYVATEVSCSEASNATLQLFRGRAMSTSHVVCEFDAVKNRGDGAFDVTMTCTDDSEAFGEAKKCDRHPRGDD